MRRVSFGKDPSLVVYDDIGGNVRQVIGYEEGREAAQPFDQPTPVDAINAPLVGEIFYSPFKMKNIISLRDLGKHGPQRTGRPQPAGGHHPPRPSRARLLLKWNSRINRQWPGRPAPECPRRPSH